MQRLLLRPVPLALVLALGCLVASSAARAQSIVVSHSGYLLGTNDVPVDHASLPMVFRLFKTLNPPGAGLEPAVWESGAPCPVTVSRGLYATALGEACGTALLASYLPFGEARYLEVTIEGIPMRPRLLIGTMPTAAVAENALQLEGSPALAFAKKSELADETGSVNAAANLVDWKQLKGVPPQLADGLDAEGVLLATHSNLAGSGTLNAPLELALEEGSVAWSKLSNVPAGLADGDDGLVEVTVGAGLSGKGTGQSPLALALLDGSVAWSKLTNVPAGLADGDQGLTAVTIGAGLEGDGTATGALTVKYGAVAGTAAAGDDARLANARAPTAGSADYLQNNASAIAQTAKFNINGEGRVGDLFIRNVNVLDFFPFYRTSSNQILNGTDTDITGWSVDAPDVTVAYQFTVRNGIPWADREDRERELLTAMGREGTQYLRAAFRVYRLSWTKAGVWSMFQPVAQIPWYTTAAMTKLESGSIYGSWTTGAGAAWKLTGEQVPMTPHGYSHPHPITNSTTGSLLVAMPANVMGYFDLNRPLNWGWFPYVNSQYGSD